MNCPKCKKPVNGEHGLKIHRSRAHSSYHVCWCLICGRGYSNASALVNHGYGHHAGMGKKAWFSTTRPDGAAPQEEVTPPAEALTSAAPAGELPPPRRWPPKEDRHNAEALADLPWLSFPATVGACDEALDAIAVALEKADRSIQFWTTLRAYVTALRKRLLQKAA